MDDQVTTLLNSLRKVSVPIDTKLNLFNGLKSSIKHLKVPESCQANIFECIRVALASQTSSQLVSVAFSTLSHFVKRLSLQDQAASISLHSVKLLPHLLERLGDARELHRTSASKALTDLWPYCHTDIETLIRDALQSANTRAKETAMSWIVSMNKSASLQFRTFVPLIVALLEDADGQIRESAKAAILELFQNAPDHAKSDLKKQMTSQNVRKAIVAYITSKLDPQQSIYNSDLKSSTLSSSLHDPHPTHSTHIPSTLHIPSSLNTIDSHHDLVNLASDCTTPLTPEFAVEPLVVHSQRELDDHIRPLLPCFDGKETEENWMVRDKAILLLRRIACGNAPSDFSTAFLSALKSLQDGLLKVSNSLRTTTSINGCQCVQELAKLLGSGFDGFCEIFLQNFIKMSSASKKISSQNGNMTVNAIIQHVTFTTRLMQHVYLAFGEKNPQTRAYATLWLRTLIERHHEQKPCSEAGVTLDLMEKCLNKGLVDANPKVREGSRIAFWVFAKFWREKASQIMTSLSSKDRLALENSADCSSSLSSMLSFVKNPSNKGTGNLRDTIVSEKRAALASKKLPERPSSAQSAFTRSTMHSSSSTSQSHTLHKSTNQHSTNGSQISQSTVHLNTNTGSLMAAPVRRPRRAEVLRPVTADPYAGRKANASNKHSTPITSPYNRVTRDTNKKLDQHKQMSSSVSGPSKSVVNLRSSMRGSHRVASDMEIASSKRHDSSDRSRQREHEANYSPRDDNLTMVLPGELQCHNTSWASHSLGNKFDKLKGRRTSHSSVGDEESFTMVIPNIGRGIPSVKEIPCQDNGIERSVARKESSSVTRSGRNLSRVRERDGSLAREARGSRSPHKRNRSRLGSSTTMGGASGTSSQAGYEVKVFEDPFMTAVTNRHSSPGKIVLKEVAGNEVGRSKRQNSCYSLRSVSGDEDDMGMGDEVFGTSESLKGMIKISEDLLERVNVEKLSVQDCNDYDRKRRLLQSGIERIKGGTIDTHGLRCIQDLIEGCTTLDIFAEDSSEGSEVGNGNDRLGKFAELAIALVDQLNRIDEKEKMRLNDGLTGSQMNDSGGGGGGGGGGGPISLKGMLIGTIRLIVSMNRREMYGSGLWSIILRGLLLGRRNFGDNEYATLDLERLVERMCDGVPGIKEAEKGVKLIMKIVWRLVEEMSSGGGSSGKRERRKSLVKRRGSGGVGITGEQRKSFNQNGNGAESGGGVKVYSGFIKCDDEMEKGWKDAEGSLTSFGIEGNSRIIILGLNILGYLAHGKKKTGNLISHGTAAGMAETTGITRLFPTKKELDGGRLASSSSSSCTLEVGENIKLEHGGCCSDSSSRSSCCSGDEVFNKTQLSSASSAISGEGAWNMMETLKAAGKAVQPTNIRGTQDTDSITGREWGTSARRRLMYKMARRIGKLIVAVLNLPNPSLRRADLDLCIKLHECLQKVNRERETGCDKADNERARQCHNGTSTWSQNSGNTNHLKMEGEGNTAGVKVNGESVRNDRDGDWRYNEVFWQAVEGIREQHANLILYYLARQDRG